MTRFYLNPGPFSAGKTRFHPLGDILEYGNDPRKNPIEEGPVVPIVARAFVGFNVGHKPRWRIKQVVDLYEELRVAQGAAPDATFYVTKGIFTSTVDGSIVRENGCQILTLFFQKEEEKQFKEDMGLLYEEMVGRLKQEFIYVELQAQGVPYMILRVTPRERVGRAR